MEDLTGKQFGPYEIREPVGEGGMAAVYKAYQASMNRHVAIKVLPRQMARSAEFVTRFKREAHLLAQLQHPHILPVFDYGQTDGYTYIVMPFMQNGTLAQLLKERRLSLPEIRRILSQIGDALGYAHARGMIHRDVKPSNVLLDERGNCLLTDFGLARMTETSAKLTSSGAIMGTPAYMSPEQGTSPNVDGRSDIYSLGVILYEMVTGQVPYNANTPMAIVFKHILDPLPSARELVPDLSNALEKVLLKSLAKKPVDRYQSADDFVKALQQAIQVTAMGGHTAPAASQATVESAPPARKAPLLQATVVSMPPAPRPIRPLKVVYTPIPTPPHPTPTPPPPAKRNKSLLWAFAGAGIIAACLIGFAIFAIGLNIYLNNDSISIDLPLGFSDTPAVPTTTPQPAKPTARPTAKPTAKSTAKQTTKPTLPAPPTVVIPPNTKFAQIKAITVNAQKQYVVTYETFLYTEGASGMHMHFFFNTVLPVNAGMPGKGPWKLYIGPQPFTDYGTRNRPANASEMCILVANQDHSVIPNSGNCFPLPDVPTVTARVETACLKAPTETGERLVTFRAGTSSLLKGFYSDKSWLFVQNPVAVDGTTCWIPIDSGVIGGDTSGVPSINP